MKCWGCGERLKAGGWYFTDAPAGKKIALCDLCHRDSVPSQHRREWRNFRSNMRRAARWVGISQSSRGLANWKVLAP